MTQTEREKLFWSKVDKKETHECWEWKESRYIDGYGNFRVGHKKVRSHRFAYESFHNRDIPDDLCVLHLCDNRACCNPSHLFIGTRSDNNQDKILKGRSGGYKVALSKARFYAGEIWLIRRLCAAKILTQDKIAKMFKTGSSTIFEIRKRKTYPCREGYFV